MKELLHELLQEFMNNGAPLYVVPEDYLIKRAKEQLYNIANEGFDGSRGIGRTFGNVNLSIETVSMRAYKARSRAKSGTNYYEVFIADNSNQGIYLDEDGFVPVEFQIFYEHNLSSMIFNDTRIPSEPKPPGEVCIKMVYIEPHKLRSKPLQDLLLFNLDQLSTWGKEGLAIRTNTYPELILNGSHILMNGVTKANEASPELRIVREMLARLKGEPKESQ